MKFLSFIILFLGLNLNLHSKVIPPNYTFKIESFDDFYPEKDWSVVNSKYAGGARLKASYPELWRITITETMYIIPILVQHGAGKISDFYAQLPSYFLHDVFHQSLISKLGMQQKYKRVDEEAVYEWNLDGLTHVYSASCTITCFPIFYTVFKTENKSQSIFERSRSSRPMDF
jgi:hypothetical protein